MNIYLEFFGYIGTALVIISMMMTSLLKLRIFNMCGGVISLIYAVCMKTWPVALLNACLVCINMFQTIRGIKQKNQFGHAVENANSGTVKYFLSQYEHDVLKICGEKSVQLDVNSEIHLVFDGGEIVGVFSAVKDVKCCNLEFAYVVPKYCEKNVGDFLLFCLDEKIENINVQKGTEEYNAFLSRLGFLS